MAPTLAQQYLHRIRDTGGDSRTKRTDCTIAFPWDSVIINRKESIWKGENVQRRGPCKGQIQDCALSQENGNLVSGIYGIRTT